MIFILLVALSSIGIPLAASILFYLTAFSLGFFPIIGALFVVALTTTLIILPVFLTTDLIRIFIYTPINAVYKTYHLTQNLLNKVLASPSIRLLALFFSNLSPQQLKALNFPFIELQKRLPDLLFASNLSVSPDIEDTFYRYWYSNSTLRALLIDNKSPFLAQCIDDYFEGKLPKPSPKITLLFKECLTEKAKKQVLSDKEHAFLENINQKDTVFPQKSLEEIWLSGIESWSYYRYLRQKK